MRLITLLSLGLIDGMKMKVEKMMDDIQDEHKLQDTLTIKRRKTRWFSLLGDTRPNNICRRYIKRMHFLHHLLTAFL
jgi:hypothetical protein